MKTLFTIILIAISFSSHSNELKKDTLLQITTNREKTIILQKNKKHIFYLRRKNKRGIRRQKIKNYSLLDSTNIRLFITKKCIDSITGIKRKMTIPLDLPIAHIAVVKTSQNRNALKIIGGVLIPAGVTATGLGIGNIRLDGGGDDRFFFLALGGLGGIAAGIVSLATVKKTYSFHNFENKLSVVHCSMETKTK